MSEADGLSTRTPVVKFSWFCMFAAVLCMWVGCVVPDRGVERGAHKVLTLPAHLAEVATATAWRLSVAGAGLRGSCIAVTFLASALP